MSHLPGPLRGLQFFLSLATTLHLRQYPRNRVIISLLDTRTLDHLVGLSKASNHPSLFYVHIGAYLSYVQHILQKGLAWASLVIFDFTRKHPDQLGAKANLARQIVPIC